MERNCSTCARQDSLLCVACTAQTLSENPSMWISKESAKTQVDLVNHPPHYQTANGLETIDVIEAFTADLKGIEAVCTANVIKYVCRWKHKNGLEDLKKARWYLNRLIEYVEQTTKIDDVIKNIKKECN